MSPPPLALYVHLPWCVRKCPYCDFNSHTAGDAPPRARYVDALVRDLASQAEAVAGREIVSIFLGGGTPSLFSGAEIGALLDAVRAHYRLAADVEITMEGNPGTVERGDLGGYRAAGVNRLSLGAQSFDAGMLAKLGRIHGPDEIRSAFRAARAAGFDNMNLDLMFALPGQTPELLAADLAAALELAPEHLSCYQLTLEPNTVFERRPPDGLPDEELAAEMQEQVVEALAAAGYARYEISAYARAGRHCRHNLNYWTYGDYLAVGAGAHGKLSDAGRIVRYRQPAHPLSYMEAVEAGQAPAMTPVEGDERLFEFMLNALRLTGGFDEALLQSRTGLPAASASGRLAGLAERGLLERHGPAGWRPTALGLRFLNDLQAEFLPEAGAAA